MDGRQQAQDYAGSDTQRGSGGYAYNNVQTDPFNTFVNTDNDSAFESSWGNQNLPPQQSSINSFDQGNHNWQQSPYQPSSFLGAPNYGAASREYDQQYSRSPSSFNYPSFDPNQNQAFAQYETPTLPYDSALYESLNNSPQFEYPGSTGLQQPHNTISPQALQTYPSSFNQPADDESNHVS